MLDVRRLKVLREVAARGSFSAAAEALSFTQSAISQHVAALERETGTQVVERSSRGIRLTEAGQALVKHADSILGRIEDAEQELAAIAGLRGGRLRLACFQSAGATLVPRAVADFHERHPDVELGMIEIEEPEAVRAAHKAGEIDLGFIYDFEPIPAAFDGELDMTHLIDDPYDAIVPKDHRLADKRSLGLAQLAGEPWVASTSGCGCRQITERACEDAGFRPNVAFECDETLAAQALVAAGVGVTILPRLALTTIHPGVVVRQLSRSTPVVRRIWAAREEGAYQSPASEAMVQILLDVAEEFRSATLEVA